MGKKKDIAGVRIPPPLLFFLCLGLSGLAEYFSPLPLVKGLAPARFALGTILFSLAGLLAFSAFSVMARHKTPFDPAKPTRNIVKQGAFQYSRNPMYTALLLILSAVAAATASFWVVLAVPVLFFLLRHIAVLPEEKYLERKFGEAYLAYKKAVRRWI